MGGDQTQATWLLGVGWWLGSTVRGWPQISFGGSFHLAVAETISGTLVKPPTSHKAIEKTGPRRYQRLKKVLYEETSGLHHLFAL